MLQRVERAVTRGKPFDIEIDGQMTRAYPGETIAAVLIVNRIPLTRNLTARQSPEGITVAWVCVGSAQSE